MRKKLLIITLALAALLGLTTIFATAASGGGTTLTLYVSATPTGHPYYNSLDAALGYAVGSSVTEDSVEIILQTNTTMGTARTVTRNITIKSDGGPYTVTNTAAFAVNSGGTLTLEHVSFTSTATRNFMTVNSGGTLIMNEGTTLTGNRINDVIGTFIMNGGTIQNCNSSSPGGGVYVTANGTFNMYDGIIQNCTAYTGGGVYVTTNGTFSMKGGTITGNKSTYSYSTNTDLFYGGGGVYIYSGTFTMDGGEISQNQSAYRGGGVQLYEARFTMNSGTINGNSTTSLDGGGVALHGSNCIFTMNGGTISNNTCGYTGGGVYSYRNSGTINMTGGTITGNTVTGGTGSGGGVLVHTGVIFNLSGGTISGNSATNRGGGVYVLVGGETSDIMENGTLNLSGTPVVRDNLAKDSLGNIDCNARNTHVTAPLLDGADVWLTYPSNEGDVFAIATSPDIAVASIPYFRNDVNLLTGTANGTTDLTWGRIAAELVQNGIVHSRYTTLAEAINIYRDPDTQMIQLADNITTPSTINKTIYLDLNGKAITGDLTINDGYTLYGLDGTSDDYQGTGTGKITNVISGGANIAPYTDTKAEHTTKEKHYLTVTEDSGISFHRYNVQVSDYYFRLVYDDSNPNDKGSAMMNFSTAVQGDSKVADAVTELEFSSSLNGGTEKKTTTEPASSLTGLKPALGGGNPYIHRSHFIFLTNSYNEPYTLGVNLMLQNNGQTATVTTAKNRTLRDILSYFYKIATTEQQTTINEFLKRNSLQPLP